MRRSALLIVAAVLAAGCKVGPNYKRPEIRQPEQFRSDRDGKDQPSFGDVKWFDIFRDEQLKALVNEALQNSYDIKIAAARVLEARGALTSTQSAPWPQINAQGSANRQRGAASTISTVAGLGQAAWEIDLFGKLRRANEAARAELLASEANQLAVRQALVTDVASLYLQLRTRDRELEVAQESLKSREESYRLVNARFRGGVASQLDDDQSASLVAQAKASVIQSERAIEQTENALSVLLGRLPGPIERGLPITEHSVPAAIPAGLPSSLLERRPDLRIAEQALVAANARIGVAKAAFFPSITLTGGGGWQSFDLTNLISSRGGVYNYGGVVDVPIFDAGRRVGNYRAAKARQEQARNLYLQTVNNSFREVSDALIGLQKAKEYRGQAEQLARVLRDQSRLANLRYTGGVSSYLEVLDTERQLLGAEQQLAQAQRDELLSMVTLYKSLGGGWQE